MKLTIILTLAVIALATSLMMCYSTSKPLREKAKKEAKKEAIEAAERKAREEEAGRERNRKNTLKLEVLSILSEAVGNPRTLKGLSGNWPHHPRGFNALSDFIERVNCASSTSEDLQFWKDRVTKQSELIRTLQIQNQEIQKALRMGQPIE